MYRIQGSDQKEYGPVTADQLRQWIAQGRVNSQSLARAEGSADWKPLGQFPEFAAALCPPPPVGLPTGAPPLQPQAPAARRRGLSTGAIVGIVCAACLVLLLPVVGILAALLLPALAQAKGKAQTIQCVNNLKMLSIGIRMYSTDNSDCFPAGTNWCDAVTAYVAGNPQAFQCVASKNGARCHYAFNARLSGISEGKLKGQAWQTVMLFETDGGWNLSGGKELLLKEMRHHTVVNVAFADGSVRQVRVADLPSLRWEP